MLLKIIEQVDVLIKQMNNKMFVFEVINQIVTSLEKMLDSSLKFHMHGNCNKIKQLQKVVGCILNLNPTYNLHKFKLVFMSVCLSLHCIIDI